MRLTIGEKEQIIRRAMNCVKSDDLERANRAFSNMSTTQLNDQYGHSGKTCNEIWNEYKNQREEWQEASDYLETLFWK